MAASLRSIAIRLLRGALVVALFMLMAGVGAYLTLTLMIKGEDTVIVPDLVGKDVLVGLETLSDLGLNTRVKEIRYDDSVPQHHVIEQDPAPGSAIKRGRDVKILVSRGPESIVMPNLSGLSLQQSRILLTENGLCQGVVSRMASPLNTVDQVISHFPSPGAMVDRKTCVNLLVSQGARRSTMAMVDLKGLALDEAIRRLEQLRLDVGYIHGISNVDAPLETVVDQAPPAGHCISAGSPVELTVNRASSDPLTGRRQSVNGVELYRFTLDYGFLNRRVQVRLNQPQLSVSLFDDFMRPGQEIWLLVPKNGNPTVLVYLDGQLVESRIMDGR